MGRKVGEIDMAYKELSIVIHLSDQVTPEFVTEEISRHDLKQVPPDEFGEQALDPITAVIVIGGVYAITHLIMSVMDRYKGGTVINLAEPQPTVRRGQEIPLGWLVVIGKDGKVSLETGEIPQDGLERIVENIFGLGKDASIAAIELAIEAGKT